MEVTIDERDEAELVAQPEEEEGEEDEEEEEAPKQRRLQFRFLPQEDVVVLREVISRFPWAAGYGNKRTAWVETAAAVQEQLVAAGDLQARNAPTDYVFTLIKRRVDVMLAAVRRGEMDSLRGGDATKAATARNKLLVILSAAMDEHYKLKARVFRPGTTPTREELMTEALRVAWGKAAAVDLTDLEAIDPDAKLLLAKPTAAALTPRRGTKRVISVSESPHETKEVPVVRRGRGRPPKKRKFIKTESSTTAAPVVASPKLAPTPPAPASSNADADQNELSIRERELLVKTRRLELEERRFEWELKQAELQTKERLALLELLHAQSALNDELLRHLKASTSSSASST